MSSIWPGNRNRAMSAQATATMGVGMSRRARMASIASTVNRAVMAKSRPATCTEMTAPSAAPAVAPVTQ
jgi:hypothetical protein